jgi:molybdopterin-guanine dinucleotide biosynthesis protein A
VAELARQDITGLVLAGGQGARMGGLDKGLQSFNGQTLAQHALARLRPQVGSLMLSANRHLADYAAFGVPVWTDAEADYAGPLAGLLAGLAHCSTDYLACVPCDAPLFPTDLVARLGTALQTEQADIAVAASADGDGLPRSQPVFCLLRCKLHDSLEQYLHQGGRKVTTWMAQHRCANVLFQDAQAFSNANTLAELRGLER